MFISPAFAQATGGAAAAGGSGTAALIQTFAPFLLIFVAFWFLVLRPQQQKQKAHAAAIMAVKKGDQVVTASGLMGRVTKVEDEAVEVEIAANVRVRVVKATLAEVGGVALAKPANDRA